MCGHKGVDTQVCGGERDHGEARHTNILVCHADDLHQGGVLLSKHTQRQAALKSEG